VFDGLLMSAIPGFTRAIGFIADRHFHREIGFLAGKETLIKPAPNGKK
jgi:hypothetical protein